MTSHVYKSKKILFAVLVLWCITLSKADNDKSVNIKVGFDLEPSEDEAPAPKNKKDDDSDSSASSEEPAKLRKKEPAPISKEDKIGSDDRDEGSDLENGRASTKGLRVDEYEPEENGKVHRSYKDSSE